jgi:hypothetical protein
VKAFEIHLNGRYLLTAGVGEDGVLTSIVDWVGRRRLTGAFHFHVGGLDSATDEHVDWSVPEVNVGDEVTVKIVETEQVTPADRRRKRER